MKKLKCTSCGAMLNNKSNTCEYCGSTYHSINENPKYDSEKKDDIPTVSNTTINDIMKRLYKLNPIAIVPLVFISFWCTGVLFASVSAFSFDIGAVSIVPLFMLAVGIFMFVVIAKKTITPKSKQFLNLCYEQKYDEAYELVKELPEYAIGKILIAFYIKKDYVLAKELVLAMPSNQEAHIRLAGQPLYAILSYYDIEQPSTFIQR